MSVGKICVREVYTAKPTEMVRAAARRMREAGVGALVVVDDSSEPVGILTDRDIAVRCVGLDEDPDTTEVSDVMTAPVRSVPETTPIEEALRLMAGLASRRVVVTDREGRLAGILALDDVLELLVEEVEAIGRLVRDQRPGG